MAKRKKRKKKSSVFSTVLLFVIFFAGLSLLLYPTVANYINELHGSKAISEYSATVAKMGEIEYDLRWSEALAYNQSLTKRANGYVLEDEQKQQYEDILNIGGNGVMGYIEIPSIDVKLPIYHGTSDLVLQVAAGHLEWTSLPVGGTSTHCVLSGHRGLPSAKLFTNLDKLVEGDLFMLRVLNEVLTYEVDQILTVLPSNTSDLQIVNNKDYCTLLTCTPYGINSHRLLVRGHRVENPEIAATVRISAEAVQIEPILVASVLAVPLLVAFMVIIFVVEPVRKKKEKGRKIVKIPKENVTKFDIVKFCNL